ncbi:DUF4287 domain-containing protein [bacterium]|nr:DUF4287 domain-containing protein [bacterium]
MTPESPGAMIKAIIAGLEKGSGKKFSWWVKLAKKEGPAKHKALTDWLRKKYALKHYHAQWIAWGVLDPARLTAYDDPDKLVNDLYSGKKEHLRPVYDKLINAGRKLGDNVDVVVCKTYSSLRNRAQFAIINPRTQSAVDLELAMPPGTKASKRLEPWQGNNEKFTHRLRIKEAGEVDAQVKKCLEQACRYIAKK